MGMGYIGLPPAGLIPMMRDATKLPEAVDAGTVKLVGTNYNLIVKEVSMLLDDEACYSSMAQANNP